MEQRRTQRFKMTLPLAITRAGAERVTLAGVTNNISSSGVLFITEREPDLGSPIEYIITLNCGAATAVNLRCVGKVLRAQRVRGPEEAQPRSFEIAATLERYEFIRPR